MFRSLRSYPMVVLLLPLVAAILLLNRFFPLLPQEEEEQKYAFVIESAPKATKKCERFEVSLVPKKALYSNPQVYLYLLRDSTRALPEFGDTVVARTQIEWYHTTGRAFAARYLILPAKTHTTPLQTRLYKRLQEAGLSGDELATVGALTLGYKEDLDPEVKRHFQASGAAHVLAVSGLHTGIIYGILLWLLTLGGRLKPRHENRAGRWAISSVIIAAMWAYAGLTGMTPSVVRAVLMVTLVEIGRMAYRNSLSINTIASAAVLILLVRPADLWSVSFQLSFAATFSIVAIIRPINDFLHLGTLQMSWWEKMWNYILGTIFISLAAQLGTMPIIMYYFGQISNYFLLTNLIVLPLATLLVPCGLLSLALGGSWAGIHFTSITELLARTMNHSVGWIESLPGSTTQVTIGSGMVAIYYLIFIAFCVLLMKTSKNT